MPADVAKRTSDWQPSHPASLISPEPATVLVVSKVSYTWVPSGVVTINFNSTPGGTSPISNFCLHLRVKPSDLGPCPRYPVEFGGISCYCTGRLREAEGMSQDSDTLTSKRFEVAGTTDDAMEFCYQQGWTDGLPVIPPTEEKVLQFLDIAGRHPSDVIGVEPIRGRVITAEKVAISAVMAGCLSEYTPVIFAVVECMVQPEFNLHGSSASTGGSAPLLVVNGPIRHKLGFCQRAQSLRPRAGPQGQCYRGKGCTSTADKRAGEPSRGAGPLHPGAPGQVQLLYRRGRGE